MRKTPGQGVERRLPASGVGVGVGSWWRTYIVVGRLQGVDNRARLHPQRRHFRGVEIPSARVFDPAPMAIC